MSIPKIIHFGLFGGWQLSELNHRCIESWRRVLPDYEIRLWNDDNGPQTPFFRRAIKEKPINAHNYMELWTLYHFGGVMLDNDIEMIRPFDLETPMFLGFQRSDSATSSINCAVMGAVPQHPIIKGCLRRMECMNPIDDPVWFGCGLMTKALTLRGMSGVNVEQTIGEGNSLCKIYDRERFYPWWHTEKPDIEKARANPRTFAAHWWEGCWAPKKRPLPL